MNATVHPVTLKLCTLPILILFPYRKHNSVDPLSYFSNLKKVTCYRHNGKKYLPILIILKMMLSSREKTNKIFDDYNVSEVNERVECCLKIVLNTVSNIDLFMPMNIIIGKCGQNVLLKKISCVHLRK